MKFTVPQGATARVGLPKWKGGTLTLDWKPVNSTEADGYLFVDEVGAGQHEVLRR